MKYPMTINIYTPDGEGGATKEAQGDYWVISYPTGGDRYYGTVPQMKARVVSSLASTYAAGSVTFSQGGEQ